jgi:four helix bundle protein
MTYTSQFERLEVWRKAHQLTIRIYKLLSTFPGHERYSLMDQMKRACYSIPFNIVEGNERRSKKEYIQFLYTAKGSAAELKYQLILAKDLGYLEEKTFTLFLKEIDDITKMISGLLSYLRSQI